MKKVLLGSIPILAVLILVMNFVGEGAVRVQAVNDLRVQANTFPSDETLNWARNGSLIIVTVFDNEIEAGFDDLSMDIVTASVESDEDGGDDSFDLSLIEVECSNFPCSTTPLLNGSIPNDVDNTGPVAVDLDNDGVTNVIVGGLDQNPQVVADADDTGTYDFGALGIDDFGTNDDVLKVFRTDDPANAGQFLITNSVVNAPTNGEVVSGDTTSNGIFFLGTFKLVQAKSSATLIDQTAAQRDPLSAPRPELLVDDDDTVDVDYRFGSQSIDIEDVRPDIGSLEPDDEDVEDSSTVDIMFELTDRDSMFIDADDLSSFGIQQENFSAILVAPDQCRTLDGTGLTAGQQGVESVLVSPTTQVAGNPAAPFILTILDVTLGPDLDRNGVRSDNVLINEAEYAMDLDGDAAGSPGFATEIISVNERGLRDVDCDGDGNADIQIVFPDVDDDYTNIDEGFEVEREINASFAGDTVFIGIVGVDNAGKFDFFDSDTGEASEQFNEIQVDKVDPDIDIIRTGVNFDSADNKYEDDERDWMQVLFDDLTEIDGDTVDADDFVVEGHDVRRAVWYDVDPEDIAGGPTSPNPGTPVDFDDTPFVCYNDIQGGLALSNCDPVFQGIAAGDIVIPHPKNDATRFAGIPESNRFAFIQQSVFLQLEDDLDADEEDFDINIVPDGIDDEAGNTQDSTDDEATDYIPPRFTVLEMTSPLPADEDGNLLVGEDDAIELIVTSDEDLDDDPDVDAFFINCEEFDSNNQAQDCPAALNGFDPSSTISGDVDEIGRNRWRVEIDDAEETGYWSIFIIGIDDSRQENEGVLGIPEDILGDTGGDGFFTGGGDVADESDDKATIFFEADVDLPNPQVLIGGEDGSDEPTVEFRNPFFIEVDFTESFDPNSNQPEDTLTEDEEYEEDNFDEVEITLFELDGVDLTDQVTTTDDQTFLIAIENIALGGHDINIQARDMAGNELEDELDIDFEVDPRDPFALEMNPGWNLFSVPGDPASTAIGDIFGPGVPVTTVYTFDPTVPGGWLVAVRDTPDDDWVGDLTDITDENGFWGLASQIVKVDIDIPRLAGGGVDGGTPLQPPALDLFPGWNLVPLVDVTGEAEFEDFVDVDAYFSSAVNSQGGVSISRILTFDTITNEWEVIQFSNPPINSDGLNLGPNSDPADIFGQPATLDDPDLEYGSAYWVFANEAFTMVPGGQPLLEDPEGDN